MMNVMYGSIWNVQKSGILNGPAPGEPNRLSNLGRSS